MPVMHAGATILTSSSTGSRLLDFCEKERMTYMVGWPHLARMMAGPNRGVLVFNVAAVLAVVMAARGGGWGPRRWVPLYTLATVGLAMPYLSTQYFWDGSTSWGPRLFFHLTPVFCLALAPMLDEAQTTRVRVLIGAGIVGFLINLPGTLLPALMIQRRAEVDPGVHGVEPVAAWKELARVVPWNYDPASYPWMKDAVLGFPPNQCLDTWWAQVIREYRRSRGSR